MSKKLAFITTAVCSKSVTLDQNISYLIQPRNYKRMLCKNARVGGV